MVLITILTGVYKPTYNWGAPHCMDIRLDTMILGSSGAHPVVAPVAESPIGALWRWGRPSAAECKLCEALGMELCSLTFATATLLVGGVEQEFWFLYAGNNHPIWLIFFRGVETTNQWLSANWISYTGWNYIIWLRWLRFLFVLSTTQKPDIVLIFYQNKNAKEPFAALFSFFGKILEINGGKWKVI